MRRSGAARADGRLYALTGSAYTTTTAGPCDPAFGPSGGPYTRPMGRTRSSRQCLQQAAFGMRPAAGAATVVDPAGEALAVAPKTRRTALHGHG